MISSEESRGRWLKPRRGNGLTGGGFDWEPKHEATGVRRDVPVEKPGTEHGTQENRKIAPKCGPKTGPYIGPILGPQLAEQLGITLGPEMRPRFGSAMRSHFGAAFWTHGAAFLGLAVTLSECLFGPRSDPPAGLLRVGHG